MRKPSIISWLIGVFGSSLCGMVSAFFFIEFFYGIKFDPAKASDPVAISNTYIVFVTLLFVISTVVITFVSLRFSSESQKTKDIHIKALINEMQIKIKEDSTFLGEIVSSILDSEDAKKAITEKIENAFQESVESENELSKIKNRLG